MSEYLKRGKGKNTGDIKKYNFYSDYRKHAKLHKLERKEYSAFLKDLLTTYAKAIVEEALELKMGKLGYIRVQSRKLHFFRKDGTKSRTLQVNWKETWEYWEQKYKLTRDEITQIEGKKVIYFENEHTNQEFYRHIWDNVTAIVKYKRFYIFKPSRQYSRLIKKIVTAPQRKIFYYG
jgi:hypothetical protein